MKAIIGVFFFLAGVLQAQVLTPDDWNAIQERNQAIARARQPKPTPTPKPLPPRKFPIKPRMVIVTGAADQDPAFACAMAELQKEGVEIHSGGIDEKSVAENDIFVFLQFPDFIDPWKSQPGTLHNQLDEPMQKLLANRQKLVLIGSKEPYHTFELRRYGFSSQAYTHHQETLHLTEQKYDTVKGIHLVEYDLTSPGCGCVVWTFVKSSTGTKKELPTFVSKQLLPAIGYGCSQIHARSN